jgi:hypothetical protein
VTTSPRTPLPDIPKGQEFPPVAFKVTSADLEAYLDSVDDKNQCYASGNGEHYLPPLLLTALALKQLLLAVELPPGSVHTGQEIEMRQATRVSEKLVMQSRVAQRSERAGLVISTLEFKVVTEAGDAALEGRATVVIPG